VIPQVVLEAVRLQTGVIRAEVIGPLSEPSLGGQTLRKNSLCHLRNADEFIAFFPNGNILNSSARFTDYFPEREYYLLPMANSQFIFNPLKAPQ
jgi:hypothetical protein